MAQGVDPVGKGRIAEITDMTDVAASVLCLSIRANFTVHILCLRQMGAWRKSE
jgi:hypothetical protein